MSFALVALFGLAQVASATTHVPPAKPAQETATSVNPGTASVSSPAWLHGINHVETEAPGPDSGYTHVTTQPLFPPDAGEASLTGTEIRPAHPMAASLKTPAIILLALSALIILLGIQILAGIGLGKIFVRKIRSSSRRRQRRHDRRRKIAGIAIIALGVGACALALV